MYHILKCKLYWLDTLSRIIWSKSISRITVELNLFTFYWKQRGWWLPSLQTKAVISVQASSSSGSHGMAENRFEMHISSYNSLVEEWAWRSTKVQQEGDSGFYSNTAEKQVSPEPARGNNVEENTGEYTSYKVCKAWVMDKCLSWREGKMAKSGMAGFWLRWWVMKLRPQYVSQSVCSSRRP